MRHKNGEQQFLALFHDDILFQYIHTQQKQNRFFFIVNNIEIGFMRQNRIAVFVRKSIENYHRYQVHCSPFFQANTLVYYQSVRLTETKFAFLISEKRLCVNIVYIKVLL